MLQPKYTKWYMLDASDNAYAQASGQDAPEVSVGFVGAVNACRGCNANGLIALTISVPCIHNTARNRPRVRAKGGTGSAGSASVRDID